MNDDMNHLACRVDGAQAVGFAGAQGPAERFQSDRAHNGEDLVRWQHSRRGGIEDGLCRNRGGLCGNQQGGGSTGCEARKARFHQNTSAVSHDRSVFRLCAGIRARARQTGDIVIPRPRNRSRVYPRSANIKCPSRQQPTWDARTRNPWPQPGVYGSQVSAAPCDDLAMAMNRSTSSGVVANEVTRRASMASLAKTSARGSEPVVQG